MKELVRGVLLPSDITYQGGVQLHLARTAPCLLVVYLFLMVLAGPAITSSHEQSNTVSSFKTIFYKSPISRDHRSVRLLEPVL